MEAAEIEEDLLEVERTEAEDSPDPTDLSDRSDFAENALYSLAVSAQSPRGPSFPLSADSSPWGSRRFCRSKSASATCFSRSEGSFHRVSSLVAALLASARHDTSISCTFAQASLAAAKICGIMIPIIIVE